MKRRVIKDFNSLSEETREDIRKQYPHGYLIKMPPAISLDEEEISSDTTISEIPGQESLEGLDEEKYLVQEEEEEESD